MIFERKEERKIIKNWKKSIFLIRSLLINLLLLTDSNQQCGTYEYLKIDYYKSSSCPDENGVYIDKTVSIEEEQMGKNGMEGQCYIRYWDDPVCRPCVHPCLRCTTGLVCLTCVPNYYFLLNRCHKVCPTSYYGRNTTMQCVSCGYNCRYCIDTVAGSCSSCYSGRALDPDGYCNHNCPDGYFEKELKCQKCHFRCLTCFGGKSDECSSCNPDFPLLMPEGNCVKDCGESHYEVVGQNKCEKCHSSCIGCYGGYKTHCIRCKFNYVFDINLVCIPKCIPGTYLKNSTHCGQCAAGCEICNGPSIRDCIKCYDNLISHYDEIFNDQEEIKNFNSISTRVDNHQKCFMRCLEGFYLEGGECKRCDGRCLSCSGSGKNDCEKCVKNMTYVNSEKKCECNSGYFNYGNVINQRGGYCHECSIGCDKCLEDDTNICLKCKKGYYSKNSTCFKICGDNFYKERGALEGYARCLRCYENCKSCFNKERNQCFSCSGQEFILLKETENSDKGVCFSCYNETNDIEFLLKNCEMSRILNIRYNKKIMDGLSSISFTLYFEDDHKFAERLKQMNHNLTDYFEVKIN